MDTSPKGNALAVAAVAGRAQPSTVKLFACSDTTNAWSLGDTLTRPANTVITSIRAVSSRIGVLCVAESNSSAAEIAHDIVFFGGSSATVETRKIALAHSDYITVVASSTENENLLLTGSRDATARVWDTRSQAVSAAHTLSSHHDTVTSIASLRDVIVTASVDQSLCLWDMRKLKSPVAERSFGAPVLRVACTAGTTAVVATSNSLSLVSLHPLQVHDVVPNVCYTEVRANHDGSVVFASRATLDAYVVQLLS
jgi:WD40 repeat protein